MLASAYDTISAIPLNWTNKTRLVCFAHELKYKVPVVYDFLMRYHASFCTAIMLSRFAGSRSAGPRAKGEIILAQKYT